MTQTVNNNLAELAYKNGLTQAYVELHAEEKIKSVLFDDEGEETKGAYFIPTFAIIKKFLKEKGMEVNVFAESGSVFRYKVGEVFSEKTYVSYQSCLTEALTRALNEFGEHTES